MPAPCARVYVCVRVCYCDNDTNKTEQQQQQAGNKLPN